MSVRYPYRRLDMAAGVQGRHDAAPAFLPRGNSVTLSGVVEMADGAFDGTPTVIAALPGRRSGVIDDGVRPRSRQILPVVGSSAGTPTIGYLAVDTDGTITLTITADWASLDGVRITRGA